MIDFLTPNKLTKKRKRTLLTKELDTIQWIDNMSGVLYDIGANVGTYSIYAGLKGIEVYAFEPEAQNYALLNQNIRLNNLNNVHAFCLALWDTQKLDYLNLSTLEAGGSLHSFGEELDYRLKAFNPVFKQGCVGMPLDAINLKAPDHIKIDVDGFEHLVLKGGEKTIKQAKSVLIELNRNIREHMTIIDWFTENGFVYDKKLAHTSMRKTGAMEGVGNIIFLGD
jgi:FkbM family methyltransferase